MIDNPFYSHEFHGEYALISIGQLDLEEGGSIPDCQLAVATFGELNEAKDNAILVTTWYSGTHQIFRDVYIGPDHALNPDKYFSEETNNIRGIHSRCSLTQVISVDQWHQDVWMLIFINAGFNM